jgi:hypothetical protein
MKRIRLNENDIENLVKRIIKEEGIEKPLEDKLINRLHPNVRDIKIDNLKIGRYKIEFDVSHYLNGIDVNVESLKNDIERALNNPNNYN